MWPIVRQLPMKACWWDAPLKLWDLAEAICKELMGYNMAIVFLLWLLVILCKDKVWKNTKEILPFANPALLATSFQQFPVTPLWWYSGIRLSYRQEGSRIQSFKKMSCSKTLILGKEKNNCTLQKILLFLYLNVKLNIKNIRIFIKTLRKMLKTVLRMKWFSFLTPESEGLLRFNAVCLSLALYVPTLTLRR